jgi:hypothetical protein
MPTRHQAYLRHAKHYWALLAVSNDVYKLGGNKVLSALSLLDSEWSNIQVGQRWAEGHINHDEVASSLCSAFPLYGGGPLDLRLSNSEHVHWLETGLTAARQSGNRKLEGVLLVKWVSTGILRVISKRGSRVSCGLYRSFAR